jgi:quercetin dioxygenase-like cupin family protein/iron-sulfur cluster repair protein YtfE (RIC family)
MAIKQSQPVVGRAAELAQYSTQEFGRKVLAETDRFRVVIAALEDGQEIPLHAPPLDMVMTIVEGIGQVMAGDQVHAVRAGDVVIVPAGQTRGLRATGGRLVAVNVVSPPPGPGDHAGSRAAAWPVDGEAPDVGALILEEHAGLFPHLDHLGSLASEATTLGEDELRTRLTEVLAFLRDGLLPHAKEEEVSVYPAAEKVLRAVGGATRTMSIDHRFVSQMVEELSGLSEGLLSSMNKERIRRLLYGLQALLQVHFTKENEVYVPLLNRLSPSERHQLYDRLSGGDGGHQNHHKES